MIEQNICEFSKNVFVKALYISTRPLRITTQHKTVKVVIEAAGCKYEKGSEAVGRAKGWVYVQFNLTLVFLTILVFILLEYYLSFHNELSENVCAISWNRLLAKTITGNW